MKPALPPITEKAFTRQVLELAELRGWRRAHFRPALTKKGWRTAMSGDTGFPDLVLARRGRVLFAELKTERGEFRPDQLEWAAALQGGAVEYYSWRPADWSRIEEVLQ